MINDNFIVCGMLKINLIDGKFVEIVKCFCRQF